MHRLFTCVRFVVALTLPLLPMHSLCTLTSLSKADPFPVYDSKDPQFFLYKRPCFDVEDPFCIHAARQRYSVSVSPFGQNACRGANFHGRKFLPARVCNIETLNPCLGEIPGPITGNRIELGDLAGRINMLALLYGSNIPAELSAPGGPPIHESATSPRGQTLPPALQNASRCLFHTEYAGLPLTIVPSCVPNNPDTTSGATPPLAEPCTLINDPSLIDPTQRYASLTFPLEYRKRGVRIDFSSDLFHGFGINLQTGIANICQRVQKIRLKRDPSPDTGNEFIENDLTCEAQTLCDFTLPQNNNNPDCTNFTENVKKLLTGNFTEIARQLGVDIEDFNETSIEEVRLNAFWRHHFPINKNDIEAPQAVCMPFAMLSASVSPGKKMCPSKLFALPFGNNGHSSFGFSTGLNIDFINTIELSGEVGVTHFFSKNVSSLRVPNSIHQKTLFPFVADARVSLGNNWHFTGKIASYHFLGNLSTYFQFVIIDHGRDTICLKCPDPAFTPRTLAQTTAWKSKLANVGFTYDISPAVALGFLWQAPLAQKNTYRSSTLLFTFNATF